MTHKDNVKSKIFKRFLPVFNEMLTTYDQVNPDKQQEVINQTINHLSRLIIDQYKETSILITKQMLIEFGNELLNSIKTQYEASYSSNLHDSIDAFFIEFHKLNPGIILKSQLSLLNDNVPYIIEVLNHQPNCTVNQLTTLHINRNNVKYIILNSLGKQQITNYPKDQIQPLQSKDLNFQAKLIDKSSQHFDINHNYLRWASAGSIVKVDLNNEKYVAVHYRDIEPYGWNIFLGSSGVDKTGKILEREFNYPSELAFRETAEELLIVNRNLNQTHNSLKYHPYFLSKNDQRYNSNNYCQDHLNLRQEHDYISISKGSSKNLSIIPTKMQVSVKDDHHIIHVTPDILFCVDLFTRGIEVVKVVEIKLSASDYLLNGEIIDNKSSKELARTPIALLPYKYINTLFSNINNIETLFSKNGQIETCKIKQLSPEAKRKFMEELKVFNYDIEKRKDIVLGKTQGIGNEVQRYVKGFQEHFDIDHCMLKDEKYLCFTPASVKLFNLLNYYV